MILSNFKLEDSIKTHNYKILTLKKYIPLSIINPKNYLDIGCFNGNTTIAVSKYFKLDKDQCHGVDINNYKKSNKVQKKMTFKMYDGLNFPYEDNSFDLISCFMLFHHIKPDNLETFIKEISRIMKPNGILLFREHDVINDKLKILLDVLHYYYDNVLEPNEVWEDTNNYYNSKKYWADKLYEYGNFIYYSKSNLKNYNKNPLRNYVCSFILS